MYDGGHLPLAENISETERFAEIVHAAGANLESEIGLFGGEYQGGEPVRAGAAEAVAMVKSGADTLAVSVGSEHGQSSRLDLELLGEIAEKTGIPLVMHGGSGIHPEDAKAATQLNVYKINIGAALINGFVEGLVEGAELPADQEPKKTDPQTCRREVARYRSQPAFLIRRFWAWKEVAGPSGYCCRRSPRKSSALKSMISVVGT